MAQQAATARHAAELAARESFGRLLSWLAWRWRDVAAAEDALGDALLKALEVWPVQGVPQAPDAWLLTVAKRRLLEIARHDRLRADPALLAVIEPEAEAVAAPDIPDERLRLLLVCAHPAIDEKVRVPLMLQTVLGMKAERIASAFLVPPVAMSQRLVRAKAKIHAAGIPFQIPRAEEWPERLAFVLDAIYVAFNAGWETTASEAPGHEGLVSEAIYLARALIQLVPDAPEALGLLSLMLHVHARQAARFGADGRFIPLTRQDPSLWSRDLIAEAERRLRDAAAFAQLGRFQLEAAIQSVHAQRAVSGRIHWPMIEGFYRVLRSHTNAIGARIGHALAIAQVRDATEAMAELDAVPESQVQCHQPYWVARGHLLRQMGDKAKSREAYQRAIGLTEDPSVRDFLVETMKG